MKTLEYSISITGKDRPGIIAAVTKVLFKLGGNLEDASMTILCGQFSMILLVSFRRTFSITTLLREMNSLAASQKVAIHIDRANGIKTKRTTRKSNPYLVSIFGRDRSGVVYQVSQLMAKRGINISDLDSKLIESGSNKIYALLLEVEVPASVKIARLESDLKKVGRVLKMDVSLKPIETLTL